MTKSNELLECMAFSDMKQIQNQVFRLSLVVHVKIGVIIRIHMSHNIEAILISLVLLIKC